MATSNTAAFAGLDVSPDSDTSRQPHHSAWTALYRCTGPLIILQPFPSLGLRTKDCSSCDGGETEAGHRSSQPQPSPDDWRAAEKAGKKGRACDEVSRPEFLSRIAFRSPNPTSTPAKVFKTLFGPLGGSTT